MCVSWGGGLERWRIREIGGVERLTIGEGERGVRRAPAQGGRGREDAQGLLEHGERVREGVDEVRRGAERRRRGRRRAEDRVEFVREARVHFRVRVEEVVGVGDGGAGRVVAGEDERLDLVDGRAPERRVHGADLGLRGRGRGLEFVLVRVEGQLDDGALSFGFEFGVAGAAAVAVDGMLVPGCEFLVEFFANEVVEFSSVEP